MNALLAQCRERFARANRASARDRRPRAAAGSSARRSPRSSPGRAITPASGPATAGSISSAKAQIEQVSRDHTEVAELVAEGLLSAEEARTWPRRNVVTRAVGVQSELELEVAQGVLEKGDTFVICSDGLTAHVRDSEILDMRGRERTAGRLRCVGRADDRAGRHGQCDRRRRPLCAARLDDRVRAACRALGPMGQKVDQAVTLPIDPADHPVRNTAQWHLRDR